MKRIKAFLGIFVLSAIMGFSFNACNNSNKSSSLSSSSVNSSAIKGNGKNYIFDKETDFIYDLTKIDGKDYVVIQGIILPTGFREPEKIKDKDEWRIYDTATIIIPETIEGYTVGSISEKEKGVNLPPFFSVKECTVSVTLPMALKIIGKNAFSYSSITSIEIPDSVVEIGQDAFRQSKIKSINLPKSLIKIGDYAFFLLNITSIIIPDTVVEIGSHAFASSSLASIKLPANLKKLGSNAFQGCLSGTLTIPMGLTVIPFEAFRVSNISEVIIPDSVISIENGAFEYCSELTTVRLPSHPIKYGYSSTAFQNCPKLSLAARKPIQESGYTGNF
jgi:hypothetical protein